jgi:hypothetical protein
MGAGAVIGSIAAVVVKRFQPLRLAAIGIVALTVPPGCPSSPAWGVMARSSPRCCSTARQRPDDQRDLARTPIDLRPKVMTALISISTLGARRLPGRRAAARNLGRRASSPSSRSG